ncbi:ribonuclease E inhibitor RraB [Microbulbifer sp. YPW16]|uniref:ribonuclease E inhibitor RraB n=1 Tax=Microbulbifer sp. YPW16 TaxID=2904242 RepID=UPI001E5A4682|nr:ribonuclease E inhibitor RraB [Microbulbifer sp. YPW16]UHQ54226.1 ribonuclease E inhibitor RraB [Microbulbifer sp. YPW16]
MSWPNDVHGDVFRSIEKEGFDFSQEVEIDFQLEFEHWPLSKDEKNFISESFAGVVFIDPDEEDIELGEGIGYAQFQLTNKLTYEFVISTLEESTKKAAHIGGRCEYWGVMFE